MSNFVFLQGSLSALHSDCVRAESYLSSDPAAACSYSRRAVEHLVGHLYDVLALPEPYQRDRAARINASASKATVGYGITQKLNLIRKVGNVAAHETKPIPPQTALQVLRELFHVAVFAAFRFSTDPGAVPTAKQFDPAMAAKLAPSHVPSWESWAPGSRLRMRPTPRNSPSATTSRHARTPRSPR